MRQRVEDLGPLLILIKNFLDYVITLDDLFAAGTSLSS